MAGEGDNRIDVGGSAVVVYWCPLILRWHLRDVRPGEAGVFVDGKKPVLQQAWQGSDGSVEWRDVPIVVEE